MNFNLILVLNGLKLYDGFVHSGAKGTTQTLQIRWEATRPLKFLPTSLDFYPHYGHH